MQKPGVGEVSKNATTEIDLSNNPAASGGVVVLWVRATKIAEDSLAWEFECSADSRLGNDAVCDMGDASDVFSAFWIFAPK